MPSGWTITIHHMSPTTLAKPSNTMESRQKEGTRLVEVLSFLAHRAIQNTALRVDKSPLTMTYTAACKARFSHIYFAHELYSSTIYGKEGCMHSAKLVSLEQALESCSTGPIRPRLSEPQRSTTMTDYPCIPRLDASSLPSAFLRGLWLAHGGLTLQISARSDVHALIQL